jgi:Flp pilus assembly protein TadB
MKREDDSLSYRVPGSQLDENTSRLVKLADDSNKPGKALTESLINNALGELKQLKMAKNQEITDVSRWEKTMGWAAMVAAGCGAVLAVVASALLKVNFLLEAAVILTMSFNWLTYIGEHTL